MLSSSEYQLQTDNKILLIGLGAIGKSFLRIIKEQGLFCSENFYCMDCQKDALADFLEAGGIAEHFILQKLEQNNYLSLLDIVEKDGYILDFSVNVKNIDLLNMCIENGIHYLSLADASWYKDPNWFSAHQHYLEYKKILRKIKNKRLPTCMLEFGMNPGMISCFLKQCIEDIVAFDASAYVQANRAKLQKYIEQNKYNKVARKLGIRYVIEVDNDNQEFSVEEKEAEVYSPWCPYSFFMETYVAPEICLGTKKEFYKYDELSDCDNRDLYVSLTMPGVEYRERIFSPQGEVEGFLSTHEEIFSMNDLLQCHGYKPTSCFVYSPSTIAERSSVKCREKEEISFRILKREAVISGGESVGIILQGDRFHSRYFGNYLDNEGLAETATVLQVSASAYAAFAYMLQNKNAGILMPEDLPHKEMMRLAQKYLKEYMSVECDAVDLKLGMQKER